MSATITIDAELKALVVPAALERIGHIDGFKYQHKIPTYRIFSKQDNGEAKVMFAPQGFTWNPGLPVASATTGKPRRLYFDKAFVDNLVTELAA